MTVSNIAEKVEGNDDAEVLSELDREKNEDKLVRKAPLYVVPKACRWVLRGGQWVCI
jgi:hypothetical protein